MSAATASPAPAGQPERTRPLGRLAALARAELALLVRSKGVMFAALVVPFALPLSVAQTVDEETLKNAGLTLGLVLLPGAIGFSLLFAVYSSLVAIYATRREELVLKRLRTGELRDNEILAGTALPSVVIGLVQSAVLVAACTVLLDIGAPEAPHLALLGILLGLVLMVVLAALTSAVSRTAESAQVMAMPVLLVLMLGSGMVVPLEVFPDSLASFCERLPLTGTMTLLRGGWTGELSGGDVLTAAVTSLAWIALSLFAVRRWFRWEPRR
ncbi:ABC transporter permease [Streptomyces sp. BRB081]|uniref:ABC transporter permease n=1 Tax=Streptomyces sp. BRB081 TaxID=2769544 RepID=UPI0018ACF018|nr:ABC transporter permease [Streptomyces sp. BRB081]MBL3805527.1 ABC transporter permease [Streptomyces sp. BRB081]